MRDYNRGLPVEDQVETEEWIANMIGLRIGCDVKSRDAMLGKLARQILQEVFMRFRPHLVAKRR